MDESRKTITRLYIVAGRARAPERRASWRQFHPYLTLDAFGGYDDQCAGPIAIIESRPGIERSDHTLQGHVLHAIGASLPRDVSAYCVELDPMVRTDVGAPRLYRELLRIIITNHAGVLSGLDSESLHDFRAGVRFGRSLLGHIEGMLPQAEIDHFKMELARPGRITGPARDLDVMLLGLRSRSKHLDEEQQGAILAQLEHERAQAQRTLAEQLTSERYRQLVERLQQSLAQDACARPGGGCGELPLVTVISRQAWRLYRGTLTVIEHVRGDTPAHELHRIRADVKELHCLIAAAASLYDPDELSVVLWALKRLQSVLGEFNDARVQANWLRQYAESMGETVLDPTLVRQAAEVLADVADGHMKELRKTVNKQLLRFGESATRAAFERVFHNEPLIELVR